MTREEALNEIRSWAIPSEKGREVLETLVPELAESEDERIRMALIKLMTVAGESYVMSATGFEKERLLAYLEKQKGPKQECGEKGMKGPQEIGCWRGDAGVCKKQKEQNPAWSEEDEKMLRTIISDGSRGVELDSKQISFLKSLRPSWKPSEEQMSMLLAVVNDPNNAGSESCHLSLESLYNDLKKL